MFIANVTLIYTGLICYDKPSGFNGIKMASYIYWFTLALLLLMVEMVTATFYMLVLSIALAAGGLAALSGFGESLQLVFSAVAGLIGIQILRRLKAARPVAASQDFDIGQPVQVMLWHENGTARVHYRGTEWDAELEIADASHIGTLYIKALRGSILILTHSKPQQ
jgi:membrane protein implicated in regulation of membrane protease activity